MEPLSPKWIAVAPYVREAVDGSVDIEAVIANVAKRIESNPK